MSNKKIGMLTFHNSLSYGATLQAYALQYVIKNHGYNAEFINYKYWENNTKQITSHSNSILKKVRSYVTNSYSKISTLWLKKNTKKIKNEFNKFRKELFNISKISYNMEEIENYSKLNYSTYVTGSDQVWSPNRADIKIFGLSFVPNNINTISYAASMGLGEIPQSKEKIMYDALHNIKHISCREQEGSKSLKKILNRNVETVIDPTLLLIKSDWEKISSHDKLPKNYVLCFFLGTQDYHRKVAKKMAKKNNCELLIIPNILKDYFAKGKKIYGCSPRQFLNLFLNASFICTDSFHGTAFAINFNKPFYTFTKRDYKEKNSTITRIESLLKTLELSDRLINSRSKVNFTINQINYKKVNEILKIERDKSLKYLIDSLADKNE